MAHLKTCHVAGGPGPPIQKNREVIKKRIKRNHRISLNKVARETGINRESVRRIVKNELGLKPYKLQKAQLLTEKMKEIRVQRSQLLLKRAAGQNVLFTDEKIFTIEAVHNHQNDRIWAEKPPLSDTIVTH